MKTKTTILFILISILFFRCSILIDPLAESIANIHIQVYNELRMDSCESNLINSTINYRLINKEFPTTFFELCDSSRFNSLFMVKDDTAYLKQIKHDSIDYVENFLMDIKCEPTFDSIDFMLYEVDSLDLFLSKHRVDSILNTAVIDKKYRIRIQGDTIGLFDEIYYNIVKYDSLNRKIFYSTNQEINKKTKSNEYRQD